MFDLFVVVVGLVACAGPVFVSFCKGKFTLSLLPICSPISVFELLQEADDRFDAGEEFPLVVLAIGPPLRLRASLTLSYLQKKVLRWPRSRVAQTHRARSDTSIPHFSPDSDLLAVVLLHFVAAAEVNFVELARPALPLLL